MIFFFSSRRRHTRWPRDWSSDVCSSDLLRVQAIVNELGGEKIDIIEWNEKPEQYVANALEPAHVVRVDIVADDKTAYVVVPDRQLSLAIGKEGQNARLAAK